MKFSIIIPVYKVEKYLSKCLDSVFAQTYSDYEIILVNDGSPDNCGKICEEYRQKYSEKPYEKSVTIITKENGGLASARNAGLKVAKGEWIVFVDSDDWIASEMLAVLDLKTGEYNADMFSFNMYKVFEKDNRLEKKLFAVEDEYLRLKNDEEKFRFLTDNLMQYHSGWEAWSRIFRRSIIEENKLFFYDNKEIFAEDYLFTLQFLMHANGMVRCCDILYYYLQREESIIHSVDYSSLLTKLNLFSQIIERETVSVKPARKNYYALYFWLFNYHIQNMLKDISAEQLDEYLEAVRRNKKMTRQLIRNKKDFDKFMIRVDWIAMLERK